MINVNGVMRKLEIRTEHLWSNSTTTTDIVFSKPFTNTCLFVTAIDDKNVGDSPNSINIESTSITKAGCKLIHNGISLYSYYYFAIGY